MLIYRPLINDLELQEQEIRASEAAANEKHERTFEFNENKKNAIDAHMRDVAMLKGLGSMEERSIWRVRSIRSRI